MRIFTSEFKKKSNYFSSILITDNQIETCLLTYNLILFPRIPNLFVIIVDKII